MGPEKKPAARVQKQTSKIALNLVTGGVQTDLAGPLSEGVHTIDGQLWMILIHTHDYDMVGFTVYGGMRYRCVCGAAFIKPAASNG